MDIFEVFISFLGLWPTIRPQTEFWLAGKWRFSKLNWLRFSKADSLNAGFLVETKPLFLTLFMASVVYLCIVHKSELSCYPIYLFSKYYVRKQPAALLDFTLRWFWTFMSSFAALSGRLFFSLHTRTILCSSVVVDVRNSLLPPGGLAGLCASFQPFSRHLREREIYIYIYY